MNKEELLNQELYFIKSNLTEAPHFVNSEFFVLFTNKALAIDFAQRISQRLKPYYSISGSPVSACVITDNNSFFQEMMSIGFSKFYFDGEGTIFDLNSIYERENKVSPEEKELYIYYMGHVKMQKSSHIGSVKTQKIASAKQYLRTGNNPKMMQRFIESQKKLRNCYKGVSLADTSVPLKSQEAFAPPLTQLDKGKENVEQVKSEISNIKNNNITQEQEKTNRPLVAAIMFVLAAMFAIAFIGVIDDGDFPSTMAYGVTAISYCGLGIAMTEKYLKRFGWAIIAVLFLMCAVGHLFSGKDTSALITCLIITIIFGGLFAFANRNNRVG